MSFSPDANARERMRHLYVSDLDGTLLNRQARLSESSRARLQRLLADGIEFTVASARGVGSIRAVLGDLPLTLPVIGFNGAFLSDLATGRHEIVNAIDRDIAGELHGLIAGYGTAPLIATFTGSEDRVYYGAPQNPGMHWWLEDRRANRDLRLHELGDAAAALREAVVCLTTIGTAALLAEIAARIDETFAGHIEMHIFENPYSPGWHWLTLHDRRASKDQGIRELKRLRGLDDRRVVAFGDQMNDLKMLQAADEACAVANAAPELKAMATHVIGHHEEDSVVSFIEEHCA